MKAVYFLQIIVFAGLLCSCKQSVEKAGSFPFYHSLTFDKLTEVWDEAIPQGNGLTGALIWQKEGRLRIAIDRADLWDLRPVEQFASPDYTYKFICDQVIEKKNITPVYKLIDERSRKREKATKSL